MSVLRPSDLSSLLFRFLWTERWLIPKRPLPRSRRRNPARPPEVRNLRSTLDEETGSDGSKRVVESYINHCLKRAKACIVATIKRKKRSLKKMKKANGKNKEKTRTIQDGRSAALEWEKQDLWEFTCLHPMGTHSNKHKHRVSGVSI